MRFVIGHRSSISDVVPSILEQIARALLLLCGLLLPGAVLMRALRAPRLLATCFAGSVLAQYATVLGLQFLSVPLSLGSLAAGLGVITALAAAATLKFPDAAADPGPRRWIPFTGLGAWTPLYLLFWALVAWRLWHEPLSGADIEFRWGFLPEQMLHHGSLDFYPPRSAEDFARYFWAESIPPGVAAMHAWAFACAGGARFLWAAPAIALQLAAVHQLVWLVAESESGERAARFATLGLAATPLLTWSALLGQETGLTALAMAGIAMGLVTWHRTGRTPWIAVAGVFAVAGSAAREYGLVFPVLVAAALALRRAPRAGWLAFAPFALVSLVWPLRTFLLTGNPFHSLPLGGLPTIDRFQDWIAFDASGGTLRTATGWIQVARYLALYAPLALAGWAALAVAAGRGRTWAAPALAAAVVLLALWAASVRFTNGGLFYSIRVTSPALVLGAIAAGIALAAAGARLGRIAAVLPALLLAAAIPATLALPKNPLRVSWREWFLFAPPVVLQSGAGEPTVAAVLHSGPVGVVAADAAGMQRRFGPAGTPVIPFWSPQADWLFDLEAPSQAIVQRWRESGVTHVLVSKWGVNFDYFNSRSRLTKPGAPLRLELVGETTLTAVFAIRVVGEQ